MNYIYRLLDVLVLLNADKLVIEGYKNPYILLDGKKIKLMREDLNNGELKKIADEYRRKYNKGGEIIHQGIKVGVKIIDEKMEFFIL